MFGRISPKPHVSLAFLLFLGCGGASAQTPTICSPADERSLSAGTFANEKLWYWQRRLNLQEWTISVLIARATDLKPRTLGNIHWDTDKKIAVIRVLDPADYQLSVPDMLDDIEFTV